MSEKNLTIRVSLANVKETQDQAKTLFESLTNISIGGDAAKQISAMRQEVEKLKQSLKMLQEQVGKGTTGGGSAKTSSSSEALTKEAENMGKASKAISMQWDNLNTLQRENIKKWGKLSTDEIKRAASEQEKALQQANKLATQAGQFDWVTKPLSGKSAAGSGQVFQEQIQLINKAQAEAVRLNATYSQLSKALNVNPATINSWNLQEKEMNDVLKKYQEIAIMAQKVGSGNLTTAIGALRGGATSKGGLGVVSNIDSQGLPGLLKSFDDLKIKAPEAYKAVSSSLSALGVNLEAQHSKTQSFIDSVKNYAKFQVQFYAGMALIMGVTQIIRSMATASMEFAQTLKNMQAVTGATNEEIALLAETAKRVAMATPLAATEVAQLGLQLLRAGLSAKDTAAAMEIAAKIAVVSGEDVKTVADTIATAMMAWKLSAEDSEKIGNTIAAALNFSRLTVQDLGVAFNYMAGVASSFNVSFEETNAILAVYSNMGAKASTIATGWVQLMSEFAAPSKKAVQYLSSLTDKTTGLGIAMSDIDPTTHKFSEILKTLETHGFDAAKALDILQIRAGRSLLIALRAGSQAFVDMEQKIDNAKQLSEGLANVLEGPIAGFKRFYNQIQVAGIELGASLMPVINIVIDALSLLSAGIYHTVHFLTSLPGAIIPVILAIKGLISAMVMLQGVGLATMLQSIVMAFGTLYSGIIAVTKGLTKLRIVLYSVWLALPGAALVKVIALLLTMAGITVFDKLLTGAKSFNKEMMTLHDTVALIERKQKQWVDESEEGMGIIRRAAEDTKQAISGMGEYQPIKFNKKDFVITDEMMKNIDAIGEVEQKIVDVDEKIKALKKRMTNTDGLKEWWKFWKGEALKAIQGIWSALQPLLDKLGNTAASVKTKQLLALGGLENPLLVPTGKQDAAKAAMQKNIDVAETEKQALLKIRRELMDGLKKNTPDLIALFGNMSKMAAQQQLSALNSFIDKKGQDVFVNAYNEYIKKGEELLGKSGKDLKTYALTMAATEEIDFANTVRNEWGKIRDAAVAEAAKVLALKADWARKVLALKADWARLVDEIYGLSDDKGVQKIEKKYATLANKLSDQFDKLKEAKLPTAELKAFNQQMHELTLFMEETKDIEISIERVGIEDALKDMKALKDIIGDSTFPIAQWGEAYAESMEIASKSTKGLWNILENLPTDVSEEMLDKIYDALVKIASGANEATTAVIKAYFKVLADGINLTEEYANAEKDVADRLSDTSRALELSWQLEEIGISKKQLANNLRMVEINQLEELTTELQKELEIRTKLDALLGQSKALVSTPSLTEQIDFYKELEPNGQKYHDLQMEYIKQQMELKEKMFGKEFDHIEALSELTLQAEKDRTSAIASKYDREHSYQKEAIANAIAVFDNASALMNEESKEYKIMQDFKKAAQIAELAMEIEKNVVIIASYFTRSAGAVAAATVQNAANASMAVTGAVASVAAQGTIPVVGFGLVAAMLAVMAGILGIAGIAFGGGGSGTASVPKLPASTVLGGAPGTGSDSVNKSMELLEDTYKMEYRELTELNNSMKDLNRNITGLVTSIVRTGGITSGTFNVPKGMQSPIESTFNQGTDIGSGNVFKVVISTLVDNVMAFMSPLINNLMGDFLAKIFGGEVDVKVKAAGIKLGAITVESLLAGVDIAGQQYADIKKTTSGGLFKRDKTKYYTLYKALDEDINLMFTNIFKSMAETLDYLTKAFGTDVEATLAYMFPEVKLNLKGKTAEEIDKIINEFVSKAGDEAVKALFDDIVKGYQQVGEGLLETAVRLAIDKAIIADMIEMTGQTFAGTIPEIIAFSEALIEMAGGLDKLTSAAQKYYDSFFSDAEQQARSYQQMTDILADMNMTLPATKDGFRDLVEGLDLTTESNQEAYVALMQLAESAAAYYAYLKQLQKEAFDFVLNLQTKIDSLTGSSMAIGMMWDRMTEIYYQINSAAGSAADRLEALKEGIALLDQWVAANIAAIQDFYRIQKEAIQMQIENINKQIEGLNEQKTVISEQISAIQKQIDLTKTWKSVLKSVEQQILDMKTSTDSPKDIFERMDVMKSEMERVKKLYEGATGEEKAGYAADLQRLIQEYLGIAQEAYQRPSPEYQQIYDEMLRYLEGIRTDAVAGSASETDLLAQIVALEEQSKSIDEQIKVYQEQIKDLNVQMAALDTQMAADIQAFKEEAAMYYQWAMEEGAKLYADQLSELGQILESNDEGNRILIHIHDVLTGISKGLDIPVPAYGEGGYVTKPTFALIGEKGPEWIVPDKNMWAPPQGYHTMEQNITITMPPITIQAGDNASPQKTARATEDVIIKSIKSGRIREAIKEAVR